MDFIHKFKHEDGNEGADAPAEQQQHIDPATTHPAAAEPAEHEQHGFLDKLTTAIAGRGEKDPQAEIEAQRRYDAAQYHPAAAEGSSSEQQASEEHKQGSGFLSNLMGGGKKEGEEEEQQHESPEAENAKFKAEGEHSKASFLDRITGKEERERERLEREEAERKAHEEELANRDFKTKLMDKVTGREKEEEARWEREQAEKNKTVFQKWSDRLNEAAGGGPDSEKTEDLLDKAIDAYQEHVMHEGPQDNESAVEQAKDEFISDYIRRMWKAKTGHEFPIHDK